MAQNTVLRLWIELTKAAQNTILRLQMEADGPVDLFCPSLKIEKRGRNQTPRVTDFCLSAQWLIGTTPTCGTRTS